MIDHIQQKGDKQKRAYSIAGLDLDVSFPEGFEFEMALPSFEAFLVKHVAGRKSICSIELYVGSATLRGDDGKLLSDVSATWGERFRLYEKEDCYITTIKSEQTDGVWTMKSSKNFSQSVIYIPDEERSINNVLSWLIMVAFGQSCLLHRTILIHASVIALDGHGYAFLGKSGTGKSTHSRLWLENIGGSELLNDDNPAVRLEGDGEVYIYGTPWSGKTECYKNIKVRMQAFIRLKQAPYNKVSMKKGIAAFVCILPSCTAIRWNKQLFVEMNNTVETIVKNTLIGELACLPNREAACLCYSFGRSTDWSGAFKLTNK